MSTIESEISYGIIPLVYRKNDSIYGCWELLLVQHCAGHWSFPKGHAESEESHLETAERELFEETKLTVKRYLIPTPFEEQYSFYRQERQVFKTVYYYVAEVEGDVVIQQAELKQAAWVPLANVASCLTHSNARKMFQAAQQAIMNHLNISSPRQVQHLDNQ